MQPTPMHRLLTQSPFIAALAILCVNVHAQDGTTYPPADVQAGAAVYKAQCAACHGPEGNALSAADLRSGRLPRASTDQQLRNVITSGIPNTAMPALSLTWAQLTAVVAYVRSLGQPESLPKTVGSAERGKMLFEGSAGCSSCHRVNGKGSRIGPDLSEIGNGKTAAALQRTLIDPTANMLPANRSVRAITADGKTVVGRRLNEDTYTVQLIDSNERLLSLHKAALRSYEVLKTSPMPSYMDRLDPQSLADVVAYLVSLRGIQ